MKEGIKIFSTSGGDPFAVFRFGTDPFEITTASATRIFEEWSDCEFDDGWIERDAIGPCVFYIRHDGTDNDYGWKFCGPKTPGSVPCYGVKWDDDAHT